MPGRQLDQEDHSDDDIGTLYLIVPNIKINAKPKGHSHGFFGFPLGLTTLEWEKHALWTSDVNDIDED